MESAEQWALVEKYRRELQCDGDSASWRDLEDDWRSLAIASDRHLKRDDCDFAEYMLPSIVSWIENIGAYPPPELLLALRDMFKRYMDAAGTLTLESVLLGKPKQRKGNYAGREAKKHLIPDIPFMIAFYGGKRRGLSDSAAATFAQADTERKYGKCPDAETMLRRRRRSLRTK